MTKTVDFYFDVGSPTAYLAFTQLPAICAKTGATLNWCPMLLGGVFQATGNHSPATIAAKAKYMFDDLNRFAARYGVPFAHNPYFPVNTLMLMRAITGLKMRDDPRLLAFVEAIFTAMWVDQKNMNDLAVVGQVLHNAGFDGAAMMALVSQLEVKDRLKTLTERAVQRGIFGAPTMFVGEQMFWGQDRLDFVQQALAA